MNTHSGIKLPKRKQDISGVSIEFIRHKQQRYYRTVKQCIPWKATAVTKKTFPQNHTHLRKCWCTTDNNKSTPWTCCRPRDGNKPPRGRERTVTLTFPLPNAFRKGWEGCCVSIFPGLLDGGVAVQFMHRMRRMRSTYFRQIVYETSPCL